MIAVKETSLNGLVFVDGYDEERVAAAKEAIEASAKVSVSVSSWSYIHSTCNPELAAAFSVDNDLLPALVGWSAKAKRFVKYEGKELDPKQAAAWMDKVAAGRVPTSVIAADIGAIDFNDNCVLDLGEDGDDFDMDDMLAEMRAEEEAAKVALVDEVEEEQRRLKEEKEEKNKAVEEAAKKKKKKKK
jgi:hypothetical protein